MKSCNLSKFHFIVDTINSSSPSGDVEVFLIVGNIDVHCTVEAPGLCLHCTDIRLCCCCHVSCLTALALHCWLAGVHCTVVAVGVLGVLTSHYHSGLTHYKFTCIHHLI